MRILNDELKSLFLSSPRIRKAGGYVKVQNNDQLQKKHTVELRRIAEAIGFDWEKTGFTFTVNVEKGVVYSPNVALWEGEPALFWGTQWVFLANLPEAIAQYATVTDVGGYPYLELSDMEDNGWTRYFTLLTTPEYSGKDQVLPVKRLFAQKRLGLALKKGFVGFTTPLNLEDLKPGRYVVTGYEVYRYTSAYGERKGYNVVVEGVGTVRANADISRILDIEEANKEEPEYADFILGRNGENLATLTTFPSTETNSKGRPVVPVEFLTALLRHMDAELEQDYTGDEFVLDNKAVSFDKGEVTINNPSFNFR